MTIEAKKSAEMREKNGEALARIFDLFDHAPVGCCLLDENDRILGSNSTLPALLGMSPAALLHHPLSRFIRPEDQELFGRFRQKLSDSGAPQATELRLEKKDGTILWVHLAANLGPKAEDAPTCQVVVSDITPYKQLELSLRHLHVVLAQLNQAIVQFRDRNELFRAACHIAVKFGDFRMAWVGLVDASTAQIKPVAHAGYEEGYLKAVHINVNPSSAFSQGPGGQAILHNRVEVCRDLETASRMSPWRDEALRRGYRSSIAVPFRLKDRPIGVLNLHLDRPIDLSADELDLLKRLGNALSFALDCFEIESDRQRAETALRASEAQNRAFIHAIPDLVFMNKRDGEYLSVHAPDDRLLAAPREAVLHRKVGELLPKGVATRCLKAIAAALDSHVLQKLTYTLLLDGRKHRFEARIAPCTADTVLTIVRDITELKPVRKIKRRKKKPAPKTPAAPPSA